MPSILRSSVAHGRIRSIDARAARARPGVHAVITAADIGEPVPKIPLRQEAMPEFARFEQPVIAHGKVRYVGEPIAVVIAESQALAEDALEAIVVDIEPLPAVADRADGAQRHGPGVRGGRHQSRQHVHRQSRATPTRRSRRAPYTRREHFKVQRLTAVPMETRGFLAEWDAAARAHHGVRRRQGRVPQPPRPGEAARACRKHSIRMVENDVGGGFGVRGEFYPEDFLIPFAARLIGRPVKWIEDRREHLHRHQSRARRRMRARDRLRPRRHDPGAARARATPTSAPISAPTARPARATSRRCSPGRTAFRTSTSTCRCS